MNEIDEARLKVRGALINLYRVLKENINVIDEKREKVEMIFSDITECEMTLVSVTEEEET